MERLDRDVGTAQAAFQERPEVFQAVRVDLSVNVLDGMIDHLMLEFV
jgi:hypothetical protein